MTTDPHPPPPDVAEAIARLRSEIAASQWFSDSQGPQPELEADILAVCAAAEAATCEGKTAIHWHNQYCNECSLADLYKRKSEQAEAEIADLKRSILDSRREKP
jgi:hypothetical protein